MCTQQHEWGAILSWGSNLEKNRKQDAFECELRLPQARAKRLRVIGETHDSGLCPLNLPLWVENLTLCLRPRWRRA